MLCMRISVVVNFLNIFLLFFLSSLILTLIISTTKSIHLKYSQDFEAGPQKIHKNKVPRIGGICLILPYIILIFYEKYDFGNSFDVVILSSIPIFLTGLLEDFTKKISANIRLFATILSSLICINFTDLSISLLGLDFLYYFFEGGIVPYILSFLALILLTQSYNIIDGLNGLCSLNSILTLAVIIYLSRLVNDETVFLCSITLIGVVFGFLIFNFPLGKIFLGDGGAYFLGFITAYLLIILPERNHDISPLTSLILAIYPAYETLRSFVRRTVIRITSFTNPDQRHLHSIINNFVETRMNFKEKWMSNSFASLITLLIPLFNCVVSALYFNNERILIIAFLIHIMLYEFFIFKFDISKNKN